MRPLGRSFAVVNVDELLAHGFVERGGSDVRVGELVGLGSGAKPHFCNVEVERFAGGGEEGFDGGGGGREKACLIEGL